MALKIQLSNIDEQDKRYVKARRIGRFKRLCCKNVLRNIMLCAISYPVHPFHQCYEKRTANISFVYRGNR
jgi:hypothetical protein